MDQYIILFLIHTLLRTCPKIGNSTLVPRVWSGPLNNLSVFGGLTNTVG